MIRTLVADSDPSARKALVSLLQRKVDPNIIFEAGNAESIILQLVDLMPDLLILDWRMHGCPEPEFSKLVSKAYPHIKIILLSVDANDAAAAKEAGVSFIHKGASPDELIATLSPFLADRKTIQ
jgi:DNA-binding NarL/FixJ family response regulator